jgi:iron-sulfur cluster repair protein YtfE (RIC family)
MVMMQTIGRGPRQVNHDLVDLLLECHERIRAFGALARKLGEQSDFGSDDVVEASLGVVRYFTQALPLHVQDEEQSILPRLKGKQPAVDAALAQMQAQHASHQRPLERVVAICGDLARRATGAPELGAELHGLAQRLERELLEHLELEETVIFPAITLHLSADEQAAIVRELRARRQLMPVPAPNV